MAILHVERIGGLAGFGGVRSRIRSRGQLDTLGLTASELQTVDSLFLGHGTRKNLDTRDGFRFQLTRVNSSGSETIEVPEAAVPVKVAECVRDEIV